MMFFTENGYPSPSPTSTKTFLLRVCLNLLGSGMHQHGHSYWKNEVLNHWILGKLFIVRQPKYHIVRYTPYYPILSPVYPPLLIGLSPVYPHILIVSLGLLGLDTLKHSEIVSISDFAAPLWAGETSMEWGNCVDPNHI